MPKIKNNYYTTKITLIKTHIQKTPFRPPSVKAKQKKRTNFKCTDVHRRNKENLDKLWRTIEKSVQYQHDPAGNVTNLSKFSFSKNVYRLLNKILNFVLTGKVYNKTQLKYDLNIIFRRIKLKGHFKGNQQAKKAHGQENHHSIKTFIEPVNKDVESIITRNPKKKSKLYKGERDSLKELSELVDVLITNADKGGVVVIWKTKDYIN